jgi:hypothetical protein
MILPIVAYGAQILRKVSASIDASYPALPIPALMVWL